MKLNINTDAAVKFTNRLEKMHRADLPVAVRGALNNAAFDVKQNTMPKSAVREFTQRQPNFFKANSRVEMAKGFDLRKMKATIGFTEGRLKGGRNFAVKDLEQQEHGGEIKGRSLIPLKQARVGGSWKRSTRRANRISSIKNIVDSEKGKGKSSEEKFIRSAIHTGKGGLILGNRRTKGSRTVFRIRTIKRVSSNTIAALDPLFSAEKDRVVKPKATGFMRSASLKSASKMERFYITQAKRRFK